MKYKFRCSKGNKNLTFYDFHQPLFDDDLSYFGQYWFRFRQSTKPSYEFECVQQDSFLRSNRSCTGEEVFLWFGGVICARRCSMVAQAFSIHTRSEVMNAVSLSKEDVALRATIARNSASTLPGPQFGASYDIFSLAYTAVLRTAWNNSKLSWKTGYVTIRINLWMPFWDQQRKLFGLVIWRVSGMRNW